MDRTHLADMLGMPSTKLTYELLGYCTTHEMPMLDQTVPLLVAEDLIIAHADPRDHKRLIEEARHWEATADARGREIEADPCLPQAQLDNLWRTFRCVPEIVDVKLVAPDGKVYELPAADKRGLNLLTELYPAFAVQYRDATGA